MSTVFEQINPTFAEAYVKRYGSDGLFPVEEAYFGKSKHLAKCEQILNAFLKDVYKDFTDAFDLSGFATSFDKMLKEPVQVKRIKDIEALMVKQFGFAEFNLIFFHVPFTDLATPNAFTPTTGILRKITADMTHFAPLGQASGGYYDKTHSYSCCVCVMPEILDCQFTGGELLAIILHEVGHNFQCTPMTNIGMIMPYLKVYQEIQKAISSGQLKPNDETAALITNFLTMTGLQYFVPEIFNAIGRMIQGILKGFATDLDPINKLLSMGSKALVMLRMIGSKLIPFENYKMVAYYLFNITNMSVIDIMDALCGYSGEVFADSFAAAYGYGPELNSGLAKVENTMTIKYNILMNPKYNPLAPVWEASVVYMEVIRTIFSMDPHPSTQRRLLNTIDKLEKDLEASDVPPKMKKSALNDLKNARKAYQDYLNASVDDRKLSVLTSWRVINDEYFGGKLEIKHILNIVMNAGQTQA